MILSLGTHLAQGKEATDMGQFNLLGTNVPECCSCGDALGSTPHLSEGDLFCTVECSNAFDERVTESMRRRSVELVKLTEDELYLAAFIIGESANTGDAGTDAELKTIASKLKTQAILRDVQAKALA